MDTLAGRYGWGFSEISNNMYWEDVWEMFEMASNNNTLEKNADLKFQFTLHAHSKEALQAWKDQPIPYPDRNWVPPIKRAEKLPHEVSRMVSKKKMTPERQARYEEVLKRVADHKKKVKEVRMEHMYGRVNG